ncbi:hypothetical protein [Marinimicrobium sp. C2-29]|uniref:hypothetical protein n=1 Tax=Marinimicrobium sp. C2-29 TaxID=3139825 RepID=UPI003138A7AD
MFPVIRPCRSASVLGTLLLWGLLASPLVASEAVTVTLAFETQVLDLDTGSVQPLDPAAPLDPEGADLLVAYHADRSPHAVAVLADESAELAFLSGVSFDSVTAEDIATLSFTATAPDRSLTGSDTLVVRTDTGAVFKLGQALEQATAVELTYVQLQ